MARLPLGALLLAAALAVCGGATAAAPASISGRLKAPAGIVDPAALVAGVRVVLNGGEYSTVTRVDGSWDISGVERGKVYMCEFQTGALVWPMYKVFVPDEPQKALSVVEYRYPGAPKIPSSHPLVASPVAAAQYFEERPKMSVWGILKNPQIIMILVMGALMFCMPAMQKNMDPEMAREMEAQQAVMGDPMGALGRLMKGESLVPETAAAEVPTPAERRRKEKQQARASST